MTSLHGWHPGERIIRRKLGLDKVPSTSAAYTLVAGDVPAQHSKFYCKNLHFLPVVSLDSQGRPWGSILSGKDGNIGYIKYPRHNTLSIEAKIWKADPFWENSKAFHKGEMLMAGIGVEVSTRRRNKFAGKVTRLVRDESERSVSLDLVINEDIGNCPKYIVIRSVEPHPNNLPVVVHENLHLPPSDRLPDEIISFILAADTVWFGTSYQSSPSDSPLYPSHVGINHRGGRPGFVRVKPSDGRTVVLPDFSGNRIMTSLGNVEVHPYASVTVVDFLTGDILYLTGDAQNLVGEASRAVMPFQDTITTIFVTGYTFIKDALPVRQKPLSEASQQISPYSPPIKLLSEEISKTTTLFTPEQDGATSPIATLKKIELHSPTIATFTFYSSVPLKIVPGQAIILDCSTLLGSRKYQHMSAVKPSLVNDDFIRTWTVSSAHIHPSQRETTTTDFQLTMRKKEGGAVTGALFSIANKVKQLKPESLDDLRELELSVNVVGVSGEFTLDLEVDRGEVGKDITNALVQDAENTNTRKLLWIAGGIGITPFMSMLTGLLEQSSSSNSSDHQQKWDVTLLFSTREPEVTLPLIKHAYLRASSMAPNSTPFPNIRFSVHVFSTSPQQQAHLADGDDDDDTGFLVVRHQGRISPAFFAVEKENLVDGREVFVCGPEIFENTVRDGLREVGVTKVKREGFAY